MKFLMITILAFFVYGLILSRVDVKIIPKELVSDHPKGFHDYRGVINVHTRLSTGTGSVQEVIQAAQDADLDFIFLTDLNIYNPPDDIEGYHNNLLVFVDGQYSYLNSRILVLGQDPSQVMKSAGQAQVVLTDWLSQSLQTRQHPLLILAHPFKPGFHWNGPYPDGIDGIEIINLKLIWQNAWLDSKFSFFWTLLICPFNERLAFLRLFENPYREFELWDSLATNRKTIAIAGTDAESRVQIFRSFSVAFPSYTTLFGLVTNHVLLNSELTGQASSDRAKIMAALRQGQFYMSLDTLANPKGFNSFMTTKNGHVISMGSDVEMEDSLELTVDLPHTPTVPFEIIIYRNGERILSASSRTTKLPIRSPGVYRVAVRVNPTLPLPDGRKWIPWIFTNPFYVKGAAAASNKR